MDRFELVSVEVEHIADPLVAIVCVKGELDFASTPRLIDVLSKIRPETHVIFDLSALRFCDSSGLGALIGAHKIAAAAGVTVYLAGLTPTVLTTIKVTMLDQLLPLRDTAQAALAEVSAA